MPIDETPATVELAVAYRAIQESKLAVQDGKRDLSRLKGEIQDLRHQVDISRKAIAETRAFIEHLEHTRARWRSDYRGIVEALNACGAHALSASRVADALKAVDLHQIAAEVLDINLGVNSFRSRYHS